ncbi:MAG TPA: hypothetical protein PKE00_10585 [Planctomycetota bacterium]|nr:hypothetical protein [Planctomycetota bacterium]
MIDALDDTDLTTRRAVTTITAFMTFPASHHRFHHHTTSGVWLGALQA